MSVEMTYKEFKKELEEHDRKVAGWLLYHQDRKIELEKEKEEIRETVLGAVSYSHEPKSQTNKKTDQVLGTIIKLDSMKKAKEVQLVEDILKILPLEKRIFLKLRQKYNNTRGGRSRYNAYVKIQVEYAEKMAKITGMSEEEVWREERTLKSWWREILDIAVRLALKRNLL